MTFAACHLSQIVTEWSLLRQAHGERSSEVRTAQDLLLRRYGGAIRRYLHGCLRNPDAAEEVFQEFAVRFLNGNLQGANPERGRFRQFLKGVLFHLIAEHRQKAYRQPAQFGTELPEPAAAEASPQSDAEFLASWREELLALAWRDLERTEAAGGQPYFSILAFRRDHPTLRSDAMAEQLGQKLGKPLTAAAVRQSLHRARDKFADFLLEHVLHSLEQASLETLREELAELQLLQYCQPAVDRFAADLAGRGG